VRHVENFPQPLPGQFGMLNSGSGGGNGLYRLHSAPCQNDRGDKSADGQCSGYHQQRAKPGNPENHQPAQQHTGIDAASAQA